MIYVCPVILFACSVLTFYFGLKILFSQSKKDNSFRLLAYMCISSGIWSLGFATMAMQKNFEIAYYCHTFGMMGVFMYLILSQVLICHMSKIPKLWTTIFNVSSLMGIPVFFLTAKKTETIYIQTPLGITYNFVPGFASTMYFLYLALIFLQVLIVSIYMLRIHHSKQLRFFSRNFLLCVLLLFVGSALDVILHFVLDIRGIPASAFVQFICTIILLNTVQINSRSKITIENMSEFIYYSISTPVLVFDADYRLQLANDAASDFLDINPTIFPQKFVSIFQLFPVSADTVANFESNSINIDSLCQRNQHHCNLAISKIHDRYQDVIGYIIVVTDLSERIKVMKSLENAKIAAEVANRSKSSFLANMSHEIRTPMNAIMGFSELILKMDINPTVQEYVADIKRSCKNLLAIINDILDISKLDSGKTELSCSNFYLAPLLQDTFHIVDIQARKKGLDFIMDIDPLVPRQLYGDKTRLRGILINLLNNAVKYTNKGTISFTLKMLEKNMDMVTLAFIISDTGIGIKESAKEHLFESFMRFDERLNCEIEGTGLGLAIVYGYVQLMGGTIDVNSVYGSGSTFTVTLTLKVIDAHPFEKISTASLETSALNTSEIKIINTKALATDDNLINLKVIKNTLEYYGFQVDTASSGPDAISLCHQTNYDLIFMDQMMPGMDGVETMRHIRTISPHYAAGGTGKIIVLTANAMAGMRNELMKEGFDEYLGKPLNFRELDRVISQLVPKEKIITNANLNAVNTVNSSKDADNTLAQFLPDVDTKEGLEHCGDDQSLYIEILHLIYDSAPEQMAELKRLLTEKRYDEYTVHIHSIKGQLLNIGHKNLGEAAKELEYASRGGYYEDLDQQTLLFIRKYKTLLTQLESLFNAF